MFTSRGNFEKNVWRPNLVQRQCRLKVYSIFTIPSLLHGCEICPLQEREED